MSYHYYTSNVLFNAKNKKGHLPTVRFHSLSPMNKTISPFHCLLDEGLSVLGGLSTDVSLGLHTFFFLVAGVVVDLGD
jgi:hypothetical protein